MTMALPQNGQNDGEGDAGAVRAQADAEGWELLDGMRRRLDELSAHTRRTELQVSQLASSIAAMVEAQRKRSRWLNINSFVAYLVFTVLCGCAFYFMYQSRTRELIHARDRAAAERDEAIKRVQGLPPKHQRQPAQPPIGFDSPLQ